MGRSSACPILDACIGTDGVLVRHFPRDTTLDVVNMITRDEAFWLHRCFLGRDPSSEDDLLALTQHHVDFDAARLAFIMSREFQNRWFPAPRYIAPVGEVPTYDKNDGCRLVVTSIVKNEAHQIGDMIQAASLIADYFVIVDTGSTDETRSVAEEALKRSGVDFVLASVDFVDFAQARNCALDLVPCDADWIFMLDADEHIVPEDVPAFRALLSKNVDGWRLPRFNFNDVDKLELPSPYPDYQARLFRKKDPPVRYVGAVPEQPVGVAEWAAVPVSSAQHGGDSGGPHIHHMGQAVATAEILEKKRELYNKLSQVGT